MVDVVGDFGSIYIKKPSSYILALVAQLKSN